MSRKRRSWEQQLRVDQQMNYDNSCTEQVKLKLNKKTDADILKWLQTQKWDRKKSMQGEIKRLIREEIAREAAESCRCTPTEKTQGHDTPKTPVRKQYLTRPDVKEYLKQYPDITSEEKARLVDWLKEGCSPFENAHCLADDSGRTMDFIMGERTAADLFVQHQKQLNEIPQFVDATSASTDADLELPF